MYEHHREQMLQPRQFAIRVLRQGGIVLIFVAVALSIGVIGYHELGGLPWIDAFLNASMILGGMGPVDPMTTKAAKLFAGFYALFSGLFFIVAAGVLLAPFLHRLLHRFHLEVKEKS
jgi:hypothetical protein